MSVTKRQNVKRVLKAKKTPVKSQSNGTKLVESVEIASWKGQPMFQINWAGMDSNNPYHKPHSFGIKKVDELIEVLEDLKAFQQTRGSELSNGKTKRVC
jgi:hypothetical protein